MARFFYNQTSVDPARISALLVPFASVPPALAQHLSIYLDLLLRWNARMNLTAVRDPEQIVTRHFGESLFAARHLYPNHVGAGAQSEARVGAGALACPADAPASAPSAAHREPGTGNRELGTLLDLGSGAGFPGLPIKLWAPRLEAVLVESNHRKATFLREAIRALHLAGISVLAARAEEISPPPPPLTITLRAVERFEQILPLAAALLRRSASPDRQITSSPDQQISDDGPMTRWPDGPILRLALLIGASQVATARSLLPDFAWHEPLPIPVSASRVLFIGHPQSLGR